MESSCRTDGKETPAVEQLVAQFANMLSSGSASGSLWRLGYPRTVSLMTLSTAARTSLAVFFLLLNILPLPLSRACPRISTEKVGDGCGEVDAELNLFMSLASGTDSRRVAVGGEEVDGEGGKGFERISGADVDAAVAVGVGARPTSGIAGLLASS